MHEGVRTLFTFESSYGKEYGDEFRNKVTGRMVRAKEDTVGVPKKSVKDFHGRFV